jgi:hypothetical protein
MARETLDIPKYEYVFLLYGRTKQCQQVSISEIKGTVSRDFLLLVFFLNQFPPSL